MVAKSFGPIFGTWGAKVRRPSSGYLPRNTGSSHQLLAHVLAWQFHMVLARGAAVRVALGGRHAGAAHGRDADLERLASRGAQGLRALP